MSALTIEGSRTASAIAQLFTDLGQEATRTQLKPGQVIYEMGEPADKIYLIHRGQVRLYQIGSDDSRRLVEILGPQQWFGCGALTGEQITATRAVAVNTTVISALPVRRVTEMLVSRPNVALEVIAQLAANLQAAREDAARLVFDDCNQRLIKTLLRFSVSAAASPVEEGVILHITHDQLAQAVGVARETVSLALTQLRQQNLLRTGRNQLSFNPNVLREFHLNQRERQPAQQTQVA